MTLGQPNQWKQKQGKTRVTFAFTPTALDYSITDANDMRRQQYRWETLPGPNEYYHITDQDLAARWVVFFMCFMGGFQIFRHQDFAMPTYGLLSVFLVVLLIGTLLLRPLLRKEWTMLPLEGGHILVIKDKQHDTILAAIEARRLAAFQPQKQIDPRQSIRTNLMRFQAMVEDGLMTAEEYRARQQELQPELHKSLLRPPMTGEPVTIEQHNFGMRVTYTFMPDHVQYDRRTWFLGNRSYRVDYRLLPPATQTQQISDANEIVTAVIFWVCLGMLAFYMSLMGSAPPGYYVGGTGLQRLLHDLTPYAVVCVPLAILCYCLSKIFRRRYTYPLPSFFILRDKQEGRILLLLEEHRRAQLLHYAQPHALNPPESHANYLEWLQEQNMIDAGEAEALMQQSNLLAVHYGSLLDRPVEVEDTMRVPPSAVVH